MCGIAKRAMVETIRSSFFPVVDQSTTGYVVASLSFLLRVTVLSAFIGEQTST